MIPITIVIAEAAGQGEIPAEEFGRLSGVSKPSEISPGAIHLVARFVWFTARGLIFFAGDKNETAGSGCYRPFEFCG